jgi:hypothetical protein
MKKRTIAVMAATAGAVLVLGGAATAVALGGASTSDGSDDSPPMTGPDLVQATSAALAEVGAGTVTESEVGGDEAPYELEISLAAGGSVDVRLDEHFVVIGVSSNNDETAGHHDAGDGDGETADD